MSRHGSAAGPRSLPQCRRRRRVVELGRDDLARAPRDLLGRCLDLADVSLRLLEMPAEVADAVGEARHVVGEPGHLGLDLPRLLAHPHVAQHRLHRVEDRHHRGGRDDPHAQAERLVDHVLEIRMQRGVDRLRRHEQQRAVGGLVGDDVFGGDVLYVLEHIGAELLGGGGARRLVGGIAQATEAFEGKLAVHPDRARRVGQAQQAIDARAVRERHLEIVVGRGEHVLHQRLELGFAEGSPCLLVREDVLKPSHLVCQRRDRRLRGIDHRQPLADAAEALERLARARRKPRIDPFV